MSGQLVSEAEARARTAEIRAAINKVVGDQRRTVELLEAAARDGVHHALGYDTFPAYVEQEFRLALVPDSTRARGDAVLRLRRLGLSTRTIAEVVGVSQSTVSRDVRRGESSDSPVRGRDGKLYPQRTQRGRAPGVEANVPDPPARGFEHAYYTAVVTVERVVSGLIELHQDDRFPGHRDRLRGHQRRLEAAAEELRRLTAELRPARRRSPLDIAA